MTLARSEAAVVDGRHLHARGGLPGRHLRLLARSKANGRPRTARSPGLPSNGPYGCRCVQHRPRTPTARRRSTVTRPSAERAAPEGRHGAMCVRRFDDSLNSAIHNTLSGFATVFIDARAQGSTVGSCLLCVRLSAPDFCTQTAQFSHSLGKNDCTLVPHLAASARECGCTGAAVH